MPLGIVAVIIFLSILVVIHEVGHFLAAKKFGLLVEEFGFGLPPRLWGKKIGETIYSINWLPFGGFVKIYGEDGRDEKEINSEYLRSKSESANRIFYNQPIWRRAIIISAGVLMNFLLGWLLISIVLSLGIPKAIIVTEVSLSSPAYKAGLAVGDKIFGAEIMPKRDSQTAESISPKITADTGVDEFTQFIKSNVGKEINLKIERDGETLNLRAVPRVNPLPGEGALGIGLIEGGFSRHSVPASIRDGFMLSIEIVKVTFVALFNLVSRIFFQGRFNIGEVAGPVGVVKIAAQAGSLGFSYLLELLALISLNLAVINILPIPALDGGRLVFIIAEKIKGSPLPVKFEKYANALGMALLLFLMAIITIKDIANLF